MSQTSEANPIRSSLVRQHWLSTREAVREVIKFERRFGETHLKLACLAALPLILTPELLNLIRINFQPINQEIPWVAEVDFLLSSLCQPIGEELYEIEPSIREVLMVELEDKFGWRILFDIARFLQAYVERQSPKTNSEVNKVLSWIARAYLDPDQVVQEIAKSLEQIGAEPELLSKLQGQLQVVLIAEVLAEPLREANEIEVYQSLVADCQTVAKDLYEANDDENDNDSKEGPGAEKNEISYTFTIHVFSGSQQGNPYQGTFSYDPALLKGQGEESLSIGQFKAEFIYKGETYTKFDDWSKVVFVDGQFKKLQLEGGSSDSRFGINSGFGLDWIQSQFNAYYEKSYEAAGENFFGYLNENTIIDGVGTVTINRIETSGKSSPSGFPPETALTFDGQHNYVNLSNPDVLNFAGQITIEATIKPDDIIKMQNIVAHGYKRDPDAEVFLRIAEDEPEYQIGSWNGGNHLAGYRIPDEDLGNWVHLAGSYDGTTWRLYRNGEQVSEAVDSIGALQVSENWAIAAAGNGKERFFQGQIGEVRLWKRACSQQEIQENRSRRLKGDELGLVGYWILDEAQATIVPDRTAHGNHGRVVQVEALQLQTGDRISLKADNGKYWNYAANGRSGKVDANAIEIEADVASDDSLFKVEILADGKIALQASNEKYLTILFTDRKSITASGDSADSNGSQFTLEYLENHKIALRAGNSKYLSRINYGGESGFNTVEAAKETRDVFCEFEVTLVEAFPSLQSFTFDIVEFVQPIETVTVNAQGEEIRRQPVQASYYTEALGAVTLEMATIPAGSFQMGSPENELNRSDNESPQHQVTVPAFFMGKYAVTQAQWQAVAAMPRVNRDLEPDPSRFKGDNRPVENVSWQDAVEFCDRLSAHTKRQYRLPSEAEWEYACRAGTTTPFHFGETLTAALANYYGAQTYREKVQGESRKETTPVGSFPPNAFGLYDMHGNVWEWCADHWHDHYRGAPTDGSPWITGRESNDHVLRGGAWYDIPERCRSAYRSNGNPGGVNSYYGFRVVSSASRT